MMPINQQRIENKDLVSIVVPIYNAEKRLSNCIDSILDQSYSCIEVILIDDGSSDDSLKICNMYAKNDNRVTVLYQKNKGVSVARNLGVSSSSGVYLTFVDADDTLKPGAIKSMVEKISTEGVDCVRMTADVVSNERITRLSESVIPGVYKDQSLKKLVYSAAVGDLLCYSWLILIKKDVYIVNNLEFPSGVSMMEDAWFYVEMLSKINSIYVSATPTYNYFIHNQGASRSMDGFSDKIRSVVEVNRFVISRKFSNDMSEHINAVHLSIIISLLMVRLDNATKADVFKNTIDIVLKNQDVYTLYKSSNLNSLPVHSRITVWSVLNRNTLLIRGILLIRKFKR